MKKETLLFITFLLFNSIFVFGQPTIEWEETFGGDGLDLANCIQQTNDGGYIVTGASTSINGDVTGNHGEFDFWILKIGSTGVKEWEQSFGGSEDDNAQSIQQTSDGGYIVGGTTKSLDGDVIGNHGKSDFWIIKLTSNGNIDWQRTIGGSEEETFKSIQPTSDGGYIITGYTTSTDGDALFRPSGHYTLLIKLNNIGEKEWVKFKRNYYESIQQTSDEGYVMVGSYGFDFLVIKLNSTGTTEWEQVFGGLDRDIGKNIQQTSDGRYIVTGAVNYKSEWDGSWEFICNFYDYGVVKLNSTGEVEWEKSYGGSLDDIPSSIQQTKDGGYIVTGNTLSSDGDVSKNYGYSDYWVVKLNNLGLLEWEKSLGRTRHDKASAIRQTSDDGFIVAGNSFSSSANFNLGGHNFWIVKLFPCNIKSEISVIENSLQSLADPMISTFQWIDCNSGEAIDGAINPIYTPEVSGDYAVEITIENCLITTACTRFCKIDTTIILSEIEMQVLADPLISSYQWLDCSYFNARPIEGATDPIFKPFESGEYAVMISQGNCTYTSECFTWLNLTEVVKDEIILFPNPAQTRILLKTGPELGGLEYTIYDSAGKLILIGKIESKNTFIDVADFPKGNYVVSIQGSKKIWSAKFVKY